jgi:rSAM/selenodomain-associated transferase 1
MNDSLTVIVFAREPEPGSAKTRLIPKLGAANTAALADAFIRDAMAKAAALNTSLVIAGSAPKGVANSKYFQALARRYKATLVEQGSGTLGARMSRTIKPFAQRGAILIGTDTPSLPLPLLRQSRSALRRKPIVIGPSLDGGYYLIGIRGEVPDIFRGVRWGGSRVLEQTVERLRREKLKFAFGPTWYDIDRWNDLLLLCVHLEGLTRRSADPCPATRRLLARLGMFQPRRLK